MTEITVTFDLNRLHSYADSFLATLWHLAQVNPAAYGDRGAGEIVGKISTEIIRRWLSGVDPEMYHHQPTAYYWQWLGRFATYEPGGAPGTPEWDQGRWVSRATRTGQDLPLCAGCGIELRPSDTKHATDNDGVICDGCQRAASPEDGAR